MVSSKELVENAISQNGVVVFSKSWCPHCKKAKALVTSHPDIPKEDVKIFELDEMDEGDEIQSYLLSKTGQRTVPNVFVHQKHVGGNDDLQAAHRSGKLKELIAA